MTLRPVMQPGFTKTLVTAIVALQLVACGGSGGGDDTASAKSIAPETINTGSTSLTWTAPVSRTDGTAISLSEIGGFYIYYGKSEDSYPNRIDLDDGTAQAVTLIDIPVGTYYMVMTTYDVDGRESDYSSVVEKTIL